MVAGAVDRLDQAPGRLRFVFDYDAERALEDEEVRAEFADPLAREVVRALSEDLAAGVRLDSRDAFRAAAGRIRERTAQKGKALFHPIRVCLTGAAGGPELEVAVPAIDRGAGLPPSSGVARIAGCRERAARFVEVLAARRVA
jgi:glutamyl/glutaminyl-tRNA synthetase